MLHYADVNKFAKGQGTIHGLGTRYSNTAVDQKMDDFLVKLAIDSYLALKEIDKFNEEHLEPEDRQPSKTTRSPQVL
jgi:hypothetical protein